MKPSDMKLTKPQWRVLKRLETEDGFGPSRWMGASDRGVCYRLKDMGLVETDGAIASSITESNGTYSGITFVLTRKGRTVLNGGSNDAAE